MINILSFLWDIVNKEYSEIGTLVLIILKRENFSQLRDIC